MFDTFKRFLFTTFLIAALGSAACGDEVCEDTCTRAKDGICDDGSLAPTLFSYCEYGTDCSDCTEALRREEDDAEPTE